MAAASPLGSRAAAPASSEHAATGNRQKRHGIVIKAGYVRHVSREQQEMQDRPPKDWLEEELLDTLDEDYEIELEDAVLSREI